MAGSKRDFLRVTDLDRAELLELIERAAEWKRLGRKGPKPLEGMTIGLVFEKASTRTRVSFEVAAHQLGGQAIFLSPRDTQLGRGEPIKDTARVLARYLRRPGGAHLRPPDRRGDGPARRRCRSSTP